MGFIGFYPRARGFLDLRQTRPSDGELTIEREVVKVV
jgi:hypothetical protein